MRVVVTGGKRGIGTSITAHFEALGHEVVPFSSADLDVTDEAAVSSVLGGLEVDVLVNNAGVSSSAPVKRTTLEAWERQLAVNATGAFLCTRAVLPAMRRNRYGRIINISSQLAHKGASGMAHYAAAKAGILGLTRSLSYEVADDNITVNAICPGPVATDMKLPPEWAARKLSELVVKRQGRVEEIAPTALLLAGEDAGFANGRGQKL